MKRRHLLKTMGLGFCGFGIAPGVSAKTLQGYFAGQKSIPRRWTQRLFAENSQL